MAKYASEMNWLFCSLRHQEGQFMSDPIDQIETNNTVLKQRSTITSYVYNIKQYAVASWKLTVTKRMIQWERGSSAGALDSIAIL